MAVNVVSVVLSILIVVGVGFLWMRGGVSGDYSGDGNGEVVVVEVADGSSLSDLAADLNEQDVVATEDAFISAANGHARSGELQPGFYRLEQRMSADSAVEALLDPENQAGTVDIPTGTRLMDTHIVASDDVRKGIFTLISEASCMGEDDCISVDELQRAAGTGDPAALGVPDWAAAEVSSRGDDPRRLEGLITPGVHRFNPQASPEEIISTLVSESAVRYEETGLEASAANVGLSPYELIVAASLVEMEAPAGDFDKVARVILNRLEAPMRIQFDSTVNYDLEDQEVATTDEDRARVTAWNTYAKDGLPDTPIASPSIEAITAMENPAEGDWLYFVTVDLDGRTVFTSTFEEHEAAIGESIANGVLDSNR
ncbi:endolytic transglycosylase MltG [uncultured Corynebacterium sp.]|uniref:endolytic transglycosylase MltG n=1 Tax=uncultured Corynebacterium sp. TaxID=159447 RepID=UPI0025D15C6B|nr:endolytic transglycosylase MltG [uncultured Corynebacterium sp.]